MELTSRWSLWSRGSVLSNQSRGALLSHRSDGATLATRSEGDVRPALLDVALLGLTGLVYGGWLARKSRVGLD